MSRLLYIISMSIFISFYATAQIFDVETIVENGQKNKRINFVYLGDGYTNTEQSTFITDVISASTDQFNISPYKEYGNFFNTYAIKVISNESGADHPQTVGTTTCNTVPVITVDNYFGTTYDFSNIHRLLVPLDGSKVTSVLADNTPYYDQANIIVNAPYYGGSGGSFATSSTHASASEIMIHEIGHSFVSLGDEYWAGIQFASERINRTQESDPNIIKWKNWIGDENIGVYSYGNSSPQSNWYRPHQNCIMRYLNKPFCAVCREGTIDRIYSLITPIDTFLPSESSISFTGIDINFSIDLILPNPNTLEIEWLLDGNTIGTNTSNITLTSSDIISNNHELTVNIEDTTNLARTYTFANGYLFSITWTITDSTLGVSENTIAKFLYKAYPNPVRDVLYFDYTAQNIQDDFILIISNIQGKKIMSKSFLPQNGSDKFPISVKNLTSGVYFLSITSTNYTKNFKFIKY